MRKSIANMATQRQVATTVSSVATTVSKGSQDVICYIDLCVCVSITRAYAAKSFKFKFPGNIICACVE